MWGHATFVCESEGTLSDVTPPAGNLLVVQDWDPQTSYSPDFSAQTHICDLSAIYRIKIWTGFLILIVFLF